MEKDISSTMVSLYLTDTFNHNSLYHEVLGLSNKFSYQVKFSLHAREVVLLMPFKKKKKLITSSHF